MEPKEQGEQEESENQDKILDEHPYEDAIIEGQGEVAMDDDQPSEDQEAEVINQSCEEERQHTLEEAQSEDNYISNQTN